MSMKAPNSAPGGWEMKPVPPPAPPPPPGGGPSYAQGKRDATEAIVRWLRIRGEAIDDGYDREYAAAKEELLCVARAIESGEHLKPDEEGPAT